MRNTIVRIILIVILLCMQTFVMWGMHTIGRNEAAHDTADEFFRYCYDHGGILINNETGEKIGCMAVTVQRGDPA